MRSPRRHRHGIGKRLIEDTTGRKGGGLEVEVHRHNPRAPAFYEAMDFRMIEERPLDDIGRQDPLVRLKRDASG